MAQRTKPKLPHPLLAILLIIAGIIINVLLLVITIPERTWTLFVNYPEFKKWLWDVAVTFTNRGNVYHKGAYNRFVWHDEGAKSGDPDESMSSVTGKNELLEKGGEHGYKWYKLGKYKFAFGKWQADILNKIDTNHNYDAIEDDEGTPINK